MKESTKEFLKDQFDLNPRDDRWLWPHDKRAGAAQVGVTAGGAAASGGFFVNQHKQDVAAAQANDALFWAENTSDYGKSADKLDEAKKYLSQAKRYRTNKRATAAVGIPLVAGGAFYIRHRRNKLERVKKPKRSRTGK